jgi:hypothetical protein
VTGRLDLPAPLQLGERADGMLVQEPLNLLTGPTRRAQLARGSGAKTISDRPGLNDPSAAIVSANVVRRPSGSSEAWFNTLWPDSAAMIVTVLWSGENPRDTHGLDASSSPKHRLYLPAQPWVGLLGAAGGGNREVC